MTSKSLFFKVHKEELRGKAPLVFMAFISMLVAMPLVLTIELQRYKGWMEDVPKVYSKAYVSEQLAKYMNADNFMVLVLALILGTIFAFWQFEYLYHKDKVDFYHSLPVKREMLFWAKYISGVIAFVVPYVICCVLGLGILSAAGFSSMSVVKGMILGIIVNILGYLLCYSATILAICLTGNLFSGVLAICTLQGYGMVLYLVVAELTSTYSKTYMTSYDSLEKLYTYTSPLGMYSELRKNTYPVGNLSHRAFAFKLIVTFGYLLFVTALAFYGYLKRRSESAGKTIAFAKLKPVVKVVITVLAVCTGSLLFKVAVYDTRQLWQIVGFLFTLFLCHVLIQTIFEQDVKAVKKGMVSTFVSAVLGGMVFGGFYIGGNIYDNSEIDYNNLAYAAIVPQSFLGENYDSGFYDTEQGKYLMNTEYVFEHMKLTDKELVKEFTKDCLKGTNEDDNYITNVYIKYTMKNNKESYRQFEVSGEIVSKYMKRFLASQEFRKGTNYSFGIDPEQVTEVQYEQNKNDYTITQIVDLPKEELQNLIRTYQEEYLNATVEELNDAVPVIAFCPCVKEMLQDDYDSQTLGKLYVYPSFRKTLAILKQGGMDIENYQKKLQDTVRKITISQDYIEAEDIDIDTVDLAYTRVSYRNREQISKLLECIAIEPYSYYTAYDRDTELRSKYSVTIEYTGQEEEEAVYAQFIKDIPEWVLEDLAEALKGKLGEDMDAQE